jgi:hypothetical protein
MDVLRDVQLIYDTLVLSKELSMSCTGSETLLLLNNLHACEFVQNSYIKTCQKLFFLIFRKGKYKEKRISQMLCQVLYVRKMRNKTDARMLSAYQQKIQNNSNLKYAP